MELLACGNLGPVYRIGGTVRRSAGPWTPTVHSVLQQVRDRGFELAPAPISFDDEYEILAYLPGETAEPEPWPAWVWSDDLLCDVATTWPESNGVLTALPRRPWRATRSF